MPILGKDSGGGSGGISNIVEDTTPQLGGNLDINGKKIVSVSNGDIDIEPNGTGDVIIGNFVFDADQTVGAGQDDYVLTYDNSGGKISLEAASGGGDFADGGDAGGAARSLGNTDNYDLHILTNNTDRLHITSDGKISTGAETSPDCDPGGVCLNTGANDGNFITLKNSDITHPFTDFAEADTLNEWSKTSNTDGGLNIDSYTSSNQGFNLRAFCVTEITGTSTGVAASNVIRAFKTDGGTGVTSLGDTANIFAVANRNLTRVIFKGNGNVEADGTVTSNSYDFAEYFESTDGTAIPNGTPIIFVGDKVRAAADGEIPTGVISATACFVGNKGLDWHGRYEKDNFGKLILDTDNCPKETKEYNPQLEFVSREERPEWNIVGILGKVYIKKGSPINPNWIFLKDANEEADLYLIK